VRWGGLGVAVAYTIASLLLWYPQWRFAGSLIDLSFRKAMANIMRPLACSLAMAGCVLALRLTLVRAMVPAIRLPILVAAGFLVYLGAIQISNVPAYLRMRDRALAMLGGMRRVLQPIA